MIVYVLALAAVYWGIWLVALWNTLQTWGALCTRMDAAKGAARHTGWPIPTPALGSMASQQLRLRVFFHGMPPAVEDPEALALAQRYRSLFGIWWAAVMVVLLLLFPRMLFTLAMLAGLAAWLAAPEWENDK